MKLTIKSSEITNREELRTLLMDDIEELAGEGAKILEPRLTWNGFPLLLVDAAAHPVIVCFDLESEESALMDGLNAIDRLSVALPWVNQVYPDLGNEQRAPRLIVVCKNDPPGAKNILANRKNLTLFRYRLLHVNEETGLWLEAIENHAQQVETSFTAATTSQPPADKAPAIAEIKPNKTTQDAGLPSFSDEEASYFQQL